MSLQADARARGTTVSTIAHNNKSGLLFKFVSVGTVAEKGVSYAVENSKYSFGVQGTEPGTQC